MKHLVFGMVACVIGIGVFTFAACRKQQQINDLEQQLTHDTRGVLTQDTSPMTITDDVTALCGEGINVYRIQTNSAHLTYDGEYAVFAVNNGNTNYTLAVVYDANGSHFSTSPYLLSYIDNYQLLTGANQVRGYKLTDWQYPTGSSTVTLAPGWQGQNVTLNDGRRINRPLPCPRACD